MAEVIVVNASRDLRSERLAQDCGAVYLKVFPPNRGPQMNTGAEAARGDVILFQHADTDLREEHVAAIQSAMRQRSIIGGAFYRKFDGRHPRLMWLEPVTRFLSRHGGTLYGDQSIFVRRDAFQRLGGFATIPLMEDVDFSRHLRAAGRIVLLDPPVQSSAPASRAERRLAHDNPERAFYCALQTRGVALSAPSLVLSGGGVLEARLALRAAHERLDRATSRAVIDRRASGDHHALRDRRALGDCRPP